MQYFTFCMSLFLLFASTTSSFAQKKNSSKKAKNDWAYDKEQWGGFEQKAPSGQITGPNLIFIEGGTFNMGMTGSKDLDVIRRVTVSSFYIDATEVPNRHYREFVTWMQKYEPNYPLSKLLPDTSLWTSYIDGKLGEQLSRDYYRLPAFDYFPVVGVSWKQAILFCKWRSDRVNEELLIANGALAEEDLENQPFRTEDYLAGNYGERQVRFSDGLLLPDYRLPTEAEWEFAALALISRQRYAQGEPEPAPIFEYQDSPSKPKHVDKRLKKTWKAALKHQKKHPLPNYYLEANLPLPKNIFEGDQNAYGIFNMNDNVSEWVQDVYRPMTANAARETEFYELNPYRQNMISADSLKANEQCPPSKLAPSAKIKNGDPAQFYSTTPKYFDAKGAEISYSEFYQAILHPADYQIIERDEKDNLHLKLLTAKEFEQHQLQLKEQKQLDLFLRVDKARVLKGASFQDEKGSKGPGYRWAWPQEGNTAFDFKEIGKRPRGFRSAMTRVGSPRGARKITKTKKKAK